MLSRLVMFLLLLAQLPPKLPKAALFYVKDIFWKHDDEQREGDEARHAAEEA